jgi:lipopolysaccharide transport system ATP-binding protein
MLWHGKRKYYREFWALRDISFQVQRSETIGIIGRNGSGKSTLLKLLCGTLTPSMGGIFVNGRIAALLELGTGFNPEFTGRENVYLNASVLGLADHEIDARLPAIFTFADIGDFIDQPVKTYSSGMYVRLAFAVMAHVDADILIIDEALAVGDIFFVQKCMRFLRKFQTQGTLLFVSHDTGSVVNLCDRALWLEQGQLRELGSAKEVCEHYLATLREQPPGGRSKTELTLTSLPKVPEPINVIRDGYDQRLEVINRSHFRNDIELFPFRFNPSAYGTKAARINDVYLQDEHGRPLHWIVGGELVTLLVSALAEEDIINPIIGFFVKDRLGQNLFGDNTYLTYASEFREITAGQLMTASFTFHMPVLPVSDYSVDVAVASGTQAEHVIHCWCHDALIFKSHASSFHQGLIGIPMLHIDLSLGDRTETLRMTSKAF